MKKLNNKGITTIEVIICFILVATITTAMYTTVNSFNKKRNLEQYKEEIYAYKNTLTKLIQDDFIKIGITSADYQRYADTSKTIHSVNCVMKDGTKRQLIIVQQIALSSYHTNGSSEVDDMYMIKYGTPTNFIDINRWPLATDAGVLDYPIPELGSYKEGERTIQDLSINNVLITISDSGILNIYIGFYHPELATRYCIQIITPINYALTGSKKGNHFNFS